MKPLALVHLPGYTRDMLAHSPRLRALAQDGFCATLDTVTPAVTCSAQASVITGLPPAGHGVVANGWYFRDHNEVWFWRQSERLMSGERVWEASKRQNSAFTCMKHFWLYGMASNADVYDFVRPAYPADGRKLPDIYAKPSSLARELQEQFGQFPLFKFWGPASDITSSRWIADSAVYLYDKHKPTLSLVYLPHLDYCLQRVGPGHMTARNEIAALDEVCGVLAQKFMERGVQVLVAGEYDIQPVDTPVHVNRVLREAGYLQVIHNATGELIDFAESRAFAVADHQIAHVYVREYSDIASVAALLRKLPGVERVYDEAGKREIALDHARSGELVLMARERHWFTYYYWMDDNNAPDFARTVDIHRKPGYDPCELILDPAITLPKAKIGWTLLKKLLGFRYVMDVIPLDAGLVKGSHGRAPLTGETAPVLLSSTKHGQCERIHQTGLKQFMLNRIFE